MDVLFENKYTRNKEWAKAAFGYLGFRRPVNVFFYVMSGLIAVLCILDILIDDCFEIWWSLLVIVLVHLLMVFVYAKNVNTSLKRDIEINGKPIEVTLFVSDEMIVQESANGAKVNLNYYDVKKAVVTKEYIYLWTKANLIYSFKKEGFIVGSCDAFIAFLKNKGIKIK